ncbi:hypothetical protein PVV74_17270 [Roseovarius sp. SK2]|uniref:hypothetical protein n=1 Tax=Roseovarius TaxID=74030 RepID=UPI00237B8B8E|nr:hypothetical protein [Roseovarius sp. SK2]MDD9727214.1 hypothetical protein [Roseovarius sp. SK2]
MTRYDTQTETVHRYQRENFRLQERVVAQQDIINRQDEALTRQREQIEQLTDRVEWLESPQHRAELHFGGQG